MPYLPGDIATGSCGTIGLGLGASYAGEGDGNGNVAGVTQQYSVEQKGGNGVNCASSLRMQAGE